MSRQSEAELAARIRHYIFDAGRGYAPHFKGAALIAIESPLVLRKISAWVDKDGWVEWDRLAQVVDDTGWSSGEKAIIRVGCSLAGYGPGVEETHRGWLLRYMLEPLDGDLAELAARALTMAATGQER